MVQRPASRRIHGNLEKKVARAADNDYIELFQMPAFDRIALIKQGLSVSTAGYLLDRSAVLRSMALKALDLPATTFNRKVKANAKLTSAESERVLGFARLVGQLEAMLEEAQESQGFNSRAWLVNWLTAPLPALGNAKPIDFIDTIIGQKLIAQLLSQIGSSAYA